MNGTWIVDISAYNNLLFNAELPTVDPHCRSLAHRPIGKIPPFKLTYPGLHIQVCRTFVMFGTEALHKLYSPEFI